MPHKSKLCFDGKRIRIRAPKKSDAARIYENVGDLELYRRTITIPKPYPKEEAERFVRRAKYYLRKGKRFAFVIADKKSDKAIGVVDLFKLDREHKSAELGYWLGKRYRGKGIMSEAVMLMLNFGFKHLKLHRIQANVFEGNIASRRVLEKCGFSYEGLSRESKFKCGKFQNEWHFAILKHDFLIKAHD
ncbi:MAG: GNAT family N-acetyltransferase [Candidatus Diapherotrites archaeon]|nr:GNAT family N-acetyltransferase [Candidatus Diapherotrites archaeon]